MLSVLPAKVLAPLVLVLALLSIAAANQSHFIGDLYLARNVQELTFAPWVWAMETASLIGSVAVMVPLTLALIVWLFHKGRKPECMLVIGGLLVIPVSAVLKTLVGRERPTADLVRVWHELDSLSFPSGHSFTAVVIFGMICYLAPLLLQRKGAVTAVRVTCVAMIGLIGLSRVYLGAHWPSDVLGGFLYGGLALSALIMLHNRWFGQKAATAAGA